ncbi:2-hydroxychromene-2-carboxylate isomerase [Salinisphaera sp. T31B1]|uniref:2-hydroxychromene-2-carboxylate isomerase n=1 Tax=Salinisphaera sp. T31B1 TaxID=727963 RepID=UPI00333F2AF2
MSDRRWVEFIFDFGSPNAYLAYRALPEVLGSYEVSVRLTPCLLGGIFKATGNQSPVTAFAQIKGKLAYQRLEMQRFIERYGIHRFSFNPHFPVNTLLVMRGLIAAEAAGVGKPYTEAVLTGLWEHQLKMDDPAIVADVLAAADLDATGLLDATRQPEIKQRLIDNTAAAVERGVFGIPTFFVGDEMFFGKDRLEQMTRYL